MKKGLLALAALTGAALTTNAALLKVNDKTFANFGLKLQIYGMVKSSAAANGDKNAVDFSIHNARIYFSGQINPIVQFGANFDYSVTGRIAVDNNGDNVADAILIKSSHEGTQSTKVRDAFINFHFMDEVNVMAGLYRVPFAREGLIDEYQRIFMPQEGETPEGTYWDNIQAPGTLTLALNGISSGESIYATVDSYRDAGVTVWGDVLNGMVKYYVGIYDSMGDHDISSALGNGKDSLGYGIRIQFTPTMLGFQGEKGYLVKETYLGKKNVLSLGVAYFYSKISRNGGDIKNKSYTVDINYEQKFGVFVPKAMLAYTVHDYDNLGTDKDKIFTIKLGVLYDQQLWLGKIGGYIKYQKLKEDYVGGGSWKPSMWAIAVPYYLADQNAKIVLQYNHYDNDNAAGIRGALDNDKNSDFTLAFQVQF